MPGKGTFSAAKDTLAAPIAFILIDLNDLPCLLHAGLPFVHYAALIDALSGEILDLGQAIALALIIRNK